MKNNTLTIIPSLRLTLCLTVLLSIFGLIYLFMFSRHELHEQFWLGGVWLIVSLILGSGIAGAVSGLPKTKVPINKRRRLSVLVLRLC